MVARVIDLDRGWCTERLDLEPLVAEHAAELGPLLDDVALHKFTGGKPLSAAALAARYARLAHRRSPGGSQWWGNWVMRVRATGAAAGTVQATVPAAGPGTGPPWWPGWWQARHRARVMGKKPRAAWCSGSMNPDGLWWLISILITLPHSTSPGPRDCRRPANSATARSAGPAGQQWRPPRFRPSETASSYAAGRAVHWSLRSGCPVRPPPHTGRYTTPGPSGKLHPQAVGGADGRYGGPDGNERSAAARRGCDFSGCLLGARLSGILYPRQRDAFVFGGCIR